MIVRIDGLGLQRLYDEDFDYEGAYYILKLAGLLLKFIERIGY
ncbi:hypothetical protein [Paenibacillus sophorae]|nr:hypothetical protein [Paenibacillus sophorae]